LLLAALNQDEDIRVRGGVSLTLHSHVNLLDDSAIEPLISALNDESGGAGSYASSALTNLTGRKWGRSWTLWWTWWKWRQLLSLPVIDTSRNGK